MITVTLLGLYIGGLLLAASLIENPIVVGLFVGGPATVFGIIAIRRTNKLDQTAVVDTATATADATTKTIIGGLNTLIDNLQEDNRELREDQQRLRDKLTKVEEDCKGIRSELAALNATINGG